MASVLIIYGSTGGNTQLVCEKVCQVLTEKGHQVSVQRVEASALTDMNTPEVIIWGASTYGHGVLQDYFIPFLEAATKENYDFKGKPCAVIGLGDPKYEEQYHLESAFILEKAAQAAHATLLTPSLLVSGPPVRHLNGLVQKWAEKLAETLKTL